MKNTAVIGAQWGDEGKGKIVHYLAEQADAIARYSGGGNAGHTVVIKDQIYRLHHIPSGIFFSAKPCILGNGMVIDPKALLAEMEELRKAGLDFKNLFISDRAHLVMPYHRLQDQAQESGKGDAKIGTTGRGIGPAYMDKVGRTGIRMVDLLEPESLQAKIMQACQEKSSILQTAEFSPASLVRESAEIAEELKPYITDTSILLHQLLQSGKKVLFEGAQGVMLDVDYGTYPFVTSSNTVAGNFANGLGIGPGWVEQVIGVSKAYTTRVGMGPFPTELLDADGEKIRSIGSEYGTTTGRPRRCGWLDLVVLRTAVRVNGLNALALTKLDVLSGFAALKIAVAYQGKSGMYYDFPASLSRLQDAVPLYKELPGWSGDISGIKKFEDLPPEARAYIGFLEAELGIPASMISVGAERDQTIMP